MVDINEGNTNHLLVHGVFGIILSIGLSFIHFLIGLPVFILSLALFTTTNGILIDINGKRYQKYASFLNYKFGQWKPLGQVDYLQLILSIERAKTNQAYLMGERGTSRSLTYDIILTRPNSQKILLYEFLKYRDASKALKAIEESLHITGQDKVAEKLKQNALRGRR